METGEYVPVNLLKDSDHTNKEELAIAIKIMINANILRYTSSSSLTWHGRP